MKGGFCPCLRSRVIQFLIRSARVLKVSPMVKYSALSLFADRFYPALSRLEDGKGTENWLLHPIGESNLQLFALVSLWVTSKIHDTPPLSVKSLKLLGDKFIKEQHYTKGDLLEAEMVLMQVLEFGIGTSNIAFVFVEELLVQLKVVARVGEHVKFEACMDVMDLLYEYEETTSLLHSSPQALAASILAISLKFPSAAAIRLSFRLFIYLFILFYFLKTGLNSIFFRLLRMLLQYLCKGGSFPFFLGSSLLARAKKRNSWILSDSS